MKKTILVMVMVLMMPMVMAATSTNLMTSFPNLKITLVNQEPDPVEPGEYVDIRWKIENIGSENAEDVQLQLIPQYPFSLDPGVSAIRDAGSVHGRQTGDVGAIVKYHVRIDPNAVEGNNEIKLMYKYKGTGWVELEAFNISIQSRQALLGIEAITFEPEKILPGQANKITITVNNLAESMLKDISMKLDFTGLKFSPVGSANEKTIGKLPKSESADVSFNIIADADAESKVHKVPLLITYTDEVGTKFTKNTTIGLIVEDNPSYIVNIEETTLHVKEKPGKIVLSVSNVGSSTLKYTSTNLLPSEDYEILGQDALYLGNIDSDDFETAEFTLYVKTNKESVPINAKLTYKDAYNREYTSQENLNLKLYPESLAVKYGLEQASSKVGVIVIIIIVAVGYYAYKRWKKKKK